MNLLLVFAVLLVPDGGFEAEVRLRLDELHALGELLVLFELAEVLIVLFAVFGVGDLLHVVAHEVGELWLFHGLFDLLELLPRDVEVFLVGAELAWNLHN